jgi:hypothetical protein
MSLKNRTSYVEGGQEDTECCRWYHNTPLPLQSVMAFHLWHEGDLYDDWSAASLATSDNAKLQAIADGICQTYNVGLEDIHQVHVFFDSTNTLHLTMDMSSLRTTLIPIYWQSVGALAPTPPK